MSVALVEMPPWCPPTMAIFSLLLGLGAQYYRLCPSSRSHSNWKNITVAMGHCFFILRPHKSSTLKVVLSSDGFLFWFWFFSFWFCLFDWLFCFLFFKTEFLCSFEVCPGTSSCRPGWSWTHRDLPTSASRVLGLKACATTTQLYHQL